MRCKYLYNNYNQCHKQAIEELVFINPRLDNDIVLCSEHFQEYLEDQGLICYEKDGTTM